MPFADEAADYRFNPFDLTKVWPHGDYPPIPVGRMVLDRNPANFFAEVEQAGFSPANLVPGIGLSPDKMLMGRIFSYHDTHLHRIGPNYEQLPINRPRPRALLQQGRADDLPPRGRPAGLRAELLRRPPGRPGSGADLAWGVGPAEVGRYAYDKHAEDDDFGQAGTLYREVMSDTDREHLVTNIAGHASDEVSADMQLRVIAYWTNVDAQLGARVAAALGHGDGQAGNGRASTEAAELVAARANRA